jgi:TonB-dependent receptor
MVGAMLAPVEVRAAQEAAGSIRGVVTDRDFDVPLAGALVSIVETGQRTTTTDQGHYVIEGLPPGRYTMVVSKEGYLRQVRADVLVGSRRLTDLDIALPGEFTDLDEFVVQDLLPASAGAEIALLELRLDSPSLMDSISADVMSRAGAGDAASGLRLVAGASVQDGKSAVIRGLPDRYVSSQMNRVRLPTADEDKRAVELDQFPTVVIQSIQVSKTFTPDQQGDASGGAVDLRLKGVPSEALFQFKSQLGYNTQVTGRSDFLSYDGGGVNFWGRDDRDIQYQNLGGNWEGAAGTSETDAPIDSKWSVATGGMRDLGNGVRVGGFGSFFYERDSSFYNDGQDDSWWVTTPGGGMTPETYQGTPSSGDFKTGLFDVTQGQESVRLGGLATLGVESEHHSLNLTYLYTHLAEDTATLAEDTRGKEYFFPGYDPNDPAGTGNEPQNLPAAPYLRLETLEYTERTTGTLQLTGRHEFETGSFGPRNSLSFRNPELEWVLAHSTADMEQPDKRQFGELFYPASNHPGAPPFIPPFTSPPTHLPYKPAANFNLGNFQRIWKSVEEKSDLAALDVKLPFEQWNGKPGYLKFGAFADSLERTFDQDTFSNFGDAGASYQGGWDEHWSQYFPSENHPISASLTDVDYRGKQDILAGYGMFDMPIVTSVSLIGGARLERTELSIVNDPEQDATWFPPDATAPVVLNPGDADVRFAQNDVLPSIGFVYEPFEHVTLRGSYSQTIARQTFKELTPIIQQEYLGGPIFIGNPDLQMSALENFDLRLDHAPYDGALLSASWFDKRIDDPIEYVQRVTAFSFTTPVNYPRGRLSGFELEARQDLGHYWDATRGLGLGANATFIESEVTLPADEAASFNHPAIQAPMSSRDMTNAPEDLYNLYCTYEPPEIGTLLALYYTVQGDTLVAGAGQSNGNYVPNIYATEYDTLNFSVTQALGKYLKLQFQAKNLTDPEIEEVYRSKYIGDDVTKSSYRKGIDYTLSVSIQVSL